jgi:hypothetical protein
VKGDAPRRCGGGSFAAVRRRQPGGGAAAAGGGGRPPPPGRKPSFASARAALPIAATTSLSLTLTMRAILLAAACV